ncbi:MAG: beta-propeller fold lactonase family protein [Chthoniobacterales bacterium]|nr:beta-propeller fold lactonase family protein [Chthoniobacterales bacterium]
MKTTSNRHPSRLRFLLAGTLFVGAATLAATALRPPKIPWAVPTARVGDNALGAAVDPQTNTVYVAYPDGSTLSVIDGSKCNSANSSGCAPIASIQVGKIPTQALFDANTDTIYVLLGGGDAKTVAVVDGRRCNAQDTSGCPQARVATASVAGRICAGLCAAIASAALDPTTHSLYVGDAEDGPISLINTAACNGSNTSGCANPPIVTATSGDSIAVDHSTHSVYVTSFGNLTVSLFDGSTCNGMDQSTCDQPPIITFSEDLSPAGPGIVDEANHTYYLPLDPLAILADVQLIDTLNCNATNTSGCGTPAPMVRVGSGPSGKITLDPATESLYVLNQSSSSISVINGATCNATNQSGCSQAKKIATGFNPFYSAFNPATHTLYVPSQDTGTVWALNTSNCNATKSSGCTPFAPTTTVGAAPTGIANNPDTHSVYVSNQFDSNVSVIDSSACNQSHPNNCQQTWPTVAVGTSPRSLGVNRSTNTIYVPNRDDGTVSVIDGAHCNSSDSSGCAQTPAATVVGTQPQEVAIDEASNIIYVANQTDNTVSVIDGTHCQGTDTSGCNQSWPTIAVGAAPQALAFNPTDNTLYVANTDDNTVSVVSGNTPIATISVGAGPRSIGFVLDKNTVFVGNRDDLTVSVIDGATCNANNTTGCSQTPPAILLAQFPAAAGNGNYYNGRRIVVDQRNDAVFIPTIGDSDVATLDGSVCTAAHPKNCQVRIVPKRMGGFSVFATLDELSGTVYVVNDDDGTVSLFGEGL